MAAEPREVDVEIDLDLENDDDIERRRLTGNLQAVPPRDTGSARYAPHQRMLRVVAGLILIAAVASVSHFAAVRNEGTTQHYSSTYEFCVKDPTCVLASPRDERSYAWSVLPNGLRVLVVSDPSSATAAASIDVASGSVDDPKTYPGLAHFLEHLVFMGSGAFPSESEYGAYLSAHGGSSNAYTALSHTNYHFSVSPPGFEGALQRFAGFFTDPIFAENSTEREVNAVDSEHKKNLLSDGWRAYQLLRHSACPKSPWNGFSTGNADTLHREGVRQALLAFHAAHYCARRMRAVVVGPQSTSVLTSLATAAFGGIPPRCAGWGLHPSEDTIRDGEGGAHGIVPSSLALLSAYPASQQETAIAGVRDAAALVSTSSTPDHAFPLPETGDSVPACGRDNPHAPPGAVRGSMIVSAPVSESHEVTLTWPMWPVNMHPASVRAAAATFIADLMGDETEEGLTAGLKNAGLASSLVASIDLEAGSTALLSLSVELSPLLVGRVTAAAERAAAEEKASFTIRYANGDTLNGLPEVLPSARAAALAVLDPALSQIRTAIFSFLDAIQGSVQEEVQASQDEDGGAAGLLGRPKRAWRVPAAAGEPSSIVLSVHTHTLPSQPPSFAVHVRGYNTGTLTVMLPVANASEEGQALHRGFISLVSEPRLGIAGGLWDDSVTTHTLKYMFPDREKADTLASSLAVQMQGLGPSDVLHPPSRRVWQPRSVLSVLHMLVPGSEVMILSSPLAPLVWDTAGTQGCVEPVYGTRFTVVPAPPLLQDESSTRPWAWSGPTPALRLPSKNRFLPSHDTIAAWARVGAGNTDLDRRDPDAEFAGLHLPSMRVHGQREGSSEGTDSAAQWREKNVRPVVLDTGEEVRQSLRAAVERARAASLFLPSSAPLATLEETGLGPTFGAVDASNRTQVWWAPDRYFGYPRTHLGVAISSPHAASSPTRHILSSLWVACVSEAARPLRYTAGQAGAEIGVETVLTGPSVPGITVEVGAFTVSMPDVLDETLALLFPSDIVSSPLQSSVTADMAATQLLLIGQELARSLTTEQPYSTSRRKLGFFLGETRWSSEQLLAAVQEVCDAHSSRSDSSRSSRRKEATTEAPSRIVDAAALVSALHAHVRSFLSALSSVQVMVYGDASSSAAAGLSARVHTALHWHVVAARAHLWREGTALPLPLPATGTEGGSVVRSPPVGMTILQGTAGSSHETNDGAYAMWWIGLKHERSPEACAGWERHLPPDPSSGTAVLSPCAVRAATASVLGALLYDPTFTALRTRQQLGYVVSAGLRASSTALTEAEGVALCRDTPVLRVGGPDARPVSLSVCPRSDLLLSLWAVVQGSARGAHVVDERMQAFTVGPTRRPFVDAAGIAAAALEWGGEGTPAFVGGAPAYLLALSEQQVAQVVEAQRRSSMSPPDSLGDVWSRLWGAVTSSSWRWPGDTSDDTAAALALVTRSCVMQLYNETVLGEGTARISAQTFSSKTVAGLAAVSNDGSAVWLPGPSSSLTGGKVSVV